MTGNKNCLFHQHEPPIIVLQKYVASLKMGIYKWGKILVVATPVYGSKLCETMKEFYFIQEFYQMEPM